MKLISKTVKYKFFPRCNCPYSYSKNIQFFWNAYENRYAIHHLYFHENKKDLYHQ